MMLHSDNISLLTEVTVLKKLGDPFIDGFIELIGGEKDPRNLMIIFSLLKVIIIEFDTEHHTEVRHYSQFYFDTLLKNRLTGIV